MIVRVVRSADLHGPAWLTGWTIVEGYAVIAVAFCRHLGGHEAAERTTASSLFNTTSFKSALAYVRSEASSLASVLHCFRGNNVKGPQQLRSGSAVLFWLSSLVCRDHDPYLYPCPCLYLSYGASHL